MQGLPRSALESMRSSEHVLVGNSLQLPNTYAAVLATKEGRLCHLLWNNEAKIRPIDRPQLASSSPSAKGQTTLGQEGAIIFGRTNIDLPGKHSLAEL